MNPYPHFVSALASVLQSARALPLGGFPTPAPRHPSPAPEAPGVLIFSPHPDDECIIGGLALRLLRESGLNVLNVAVTQGSNKARQAERLAELTEACHYLGFQLRTTVPGGLERVSPKTRTDDPDTWNRSVEVIASILQQHTPRAILFPHDQDWNSTHVGVHHLVRDALQTLGTSLSCYTIETEFWGQMDDPNLTVELSTTDLADLVAATSFHVGEVKRNPYHLLLPAWMMDNVRRGGELVGGQGQAAPDFVFATLYRLQRWHGGKLSRFYTGGRVLPQQTSPTTLFNA